MRAILFVILLVSAVTAEDWRDRGFAAPPLERERKSENGSLLWTGVLGSHRLLHSGGVHDLEFTPDGRFVLSAGRDQSVRQWDIETGVEVRRFRGDHCVAISASGRRLVTGADDMIIRVFDFHTGALELELKDFGGPSGKYGWEANHDVSFSPDGKWIVSEGKGKLIVWNARDGTVMCKRDSNGSFWIPQIVFPPKRNFFLLAGNSQLQVRRLPDGKLLRTIGVDAVGIEDVACDPAGKWIVLTTYKGPVLFVDLDTGETVRTLKGNDYGDQSIVVGRSGREILWSGSDGNRHKPIYRATLADGKRGKPMHGHFDTIQALALSPDGKLIASGGEDHQVRLWDMATGKQRHALPRHVGPVTAISASKNFVVTGGADGITRSWDPLNLRLRRTFDGRQRDTCAVAVHPDGKHVISGYLDNDAIGWNENTGQEVARYKGHNAPIYGVTPTRDGKELFTAGGRWVRRWNVESGANTAILKQHKTWVTALRVSPDGTKLATGSHDGTFVVWNVQTNKAERVVPTDFGRVLSLSWSADGGRIATGGEKSIGLWDAATGKAIHTLEGHDNRVEALAFGPLRRLYSVSADKTLRVWNPASGKQVDRITLRAEATCLVIVGRVLWVGCADGSVCRIEVQ